MKKINEELFKDYDEIVEFIHRAVSLRTRALASLLYLTGCRISEVLNYVKKANFKDKYMIIDGYEVHYIEVKTRNLKHKRVRIKRQPIRLDRKIEKELYKNIQMYMAERGDNEFIFPISRKTVHPLLKKAYGIGPHYFRHFRLSHLAAHYNFTDQQLVQFAGWTDSRPAKWYMHFRTKDLLLKL